MIEIRVLGGVAVLRDGVEVDIGGAKRRAVLVSLVVDLGKPVSPGVLIDHLWGDAPPPSAETSLQAYVSTLRRVLEPERKPREAAQVLVTRAAGYALLVPREAVDAYACEDLALAGHAALARGDAAAASSLLDRALSRWAGPPGPELAGEPWLDVFASRLAQIHAQAREDRFDAGLALGEHAALIAPIEAAVVDEPFRERLRWQLALALFRSGRQREALQSLQTARAVLLDEAGIDPGPELRQLEADILAQSPALASPVPAPVLDVPSDAGSSDRLFVGRDHEIQVLLDAATAARRGTGSSVVISGEPGIGKTRLVEELTARVPEMLVVWARCPESAGQAAYWPCIQIAQQLEADDEAHDAAALLASDPQGTDPFGHHQALARRLVRAGRPMVLVIDDLHWADPASLRVFELLAGELRSVPTLLLVTTRPVGSDPPPALVDCLAELARQPHAVRLGLTGISERAVEAWLEDRASPGVAEVVHGRTGGNPFFVREVIELLASEGRLADAESVAQSRRVPAAVQDVIRRRVARMPGEVQQLLSTASAIGRWFDVDVLSSVAGVTALDVLEGLEPALQAGIVDATDLPGRFAFSHALVADTLAAELSSVRRARLHAAIATSLIELRAGDLDSHVAEIAHHAFEGAAAGSAELALEWTMRSARAAAAALAFEDAADECTRALHALTLARPSDRSARLDILIELARAHIGNDTISEAFSVLAQAVPLAIELGDLARVGESAALSNIDGLWFAGEIGMTDTDIVPVLERALAALPADVSTTRALILGGIAESGYWAVAPDQLDRVSAEAVSVAAATGDRDVLVRSLIKRSQTLWRPGTLQERVVAAEELLDLVRSGLRPVSLAHVFYAAGAVAWEQCDIVLARERIFRARELARRAGSIALVTQLATFSASIHLWSGELDEADRAVDEFYDVYRHGRRWSGEVFWAGYRSVSAFERGDREALRGYWQMIQGSLFEGPYTELYACFLAELGLLDEAAALVVGREPVLLDSYLYLGTLGGAAHARVSVGDRTGAAALREPLQRYRERSASLGTGPAFGDVAFALARVEHLLGHTDEAVALMDESIARLTPGGPGPWLGRALRFRFELTGSDQDIQAARDIASRLNLALLSAQVGLK